MFGTYRSANTATLDSDSYTIIFERLELIRFQVEILYRFEYGPESVVSADIRDSL